MKNIVWILFTLSVLSVRSSAQDPIPTSGLVAYYPFCGNYNDVSGNKHDLSHSNTTFCVDRFGMANQAVFFNDTDGLLYLGTFFPASGDFTYACWVMAYGNENACIMYNGNTNTDGCGFVMNDGTCPGFGTTADILFGGVDCDFEGLTVTINQWHHLVFRRTGTSFDYFVDTVLIDSKTGSFLSPTGKFHFGLDYTNETNPFWGRIDDAAVYNRALTTAEIGRLYRGCYELATKQPFSVSSSLGSTVSFSVAAAVTPATYQWQYKSGSGWVDLTNTSPYSGVTTNTITISPVSSAQIGVFYRCIISNPYCCSVPSDSAQITISIPVDTLYIIHQAADCRQYSFTAISGDTSINSYSWDFGDGGTGNGNPVTHKYAAGGSYTVTVITTNGSGKKDTAIESINVPITIAKITASVDTTICKGESVQLYASGANSYQWSPSVGLDNPDIADPIATPDATTLYTVTGMDSNCIIGDSVLVTVDLCDFGIAVPSAFTPNGDGVNDILFAKGKNIRSIQFEIYNRWGNKVFESDNINNGWDGTYKGREQPVETYAYFIRAISIDGRQIKKKGSITLIR
jgi:gliding motility-associated-like protein